MLLFFYVNSVREVIALTEDSVLESLGIQQLGDRVILKSLCKKAIKG